MIGIGIVGCGYVADYYLQSLQAYPNIKILGLTDKNDSRSRLLGKNYQLHVAENLTELVNNPQIQIIVNLTNPKSHYEVSKICLENNKHVYSEKPLALDFQHAKSLVDLAKIQGLTLACAPCNLLGESAQTLWKALREGMIGRPLIVYAELDDGPIYKMQPENWRSKSGLPWPAKDEFEVGCTLEHAGYYLSWLGAFFGPAKNVTAFSQCLIPDKGTKEPLSPSDTPDFSVATIEYESGVAARLTCSIISPHDHSIRIVGENGILSVEECWHNTAPVTFQSFTKKGLKAMRYPVVRNTPLLASLLGVKTEKIPLVKKTKFKHRLQREYMDFASGINELANSIIEKRPCRLSSEFCLHQTEIALAIQKNRNFSESYRLQTSFDPIEPMPWAK